MSVQERLRAAIDRQQQNLRASVPPHLEAAVLALIRGGDRLPSMFGVEPVPMHDLVSGRRLADPGGNKAMQLCLEATTDESTVSPPNDLDSWAEQFREECADLVDAEMVLGHCETGFMRIVDDGIGTFDAWIATKREPTAWRERAGIDWWASLLARRHQDHLRELQTDADSNNDSNHREFANLVLETMSWQLPYPPGAVIGGCTVQTYRDVLGWMIARALKALWTREHGNVMIPQPEKRMVAEIASDLALDPDLVHKVVAGFTLDRDNAAWHAVVPGIAPAPLIRTGPDSLVWSFRGLTSEPLLFLTHELKRRDAPDYHNSAYLREQVFRQDLYALFDDKRFVTAATRIELRREARDLRTDIDAAVFDRKTGTLGLFELKSHDPLAHSTAALVRQRDNVLYANRQISGVLDWVKRHGADEILNRIDRRTAKNFRVQKVFPFVLGRYVVHFNDGPVPDKRAAWGTWPQLLRVLDGQPTSAIGASPIATLFARLVNVASPDRPSTDLPAREFRIGETRLTVHASYAAFQSSSSASGSTSPGVHSGHRE